MSADIYEVTMPKLGETVTEGVVSQWLKQVGDNVAFDDPLFEVSTDKVDSEVPSPYDGVLLEILVSEGDTVPVGTPLARIGEPGAESAPSSAPPAGAAAQVPETDEPATELAAVTTPPAGNGQSGVLLYSVNGSGGATVAGNKIGTAGRNTKLQFILTGFTQDAGFRVFAFERIGDDRVRTKFIVRADLTLARTYGIAIQELSLLCRGILERRELIGEEGDESHSLTFTKDEMESCANVRTAARDAAKKRKPPHRPTSENLGAAWRSQPVSLPTHTRQEADLNIRSTP